MRFSFSKPSPPPAVAKVDPLRQQISRLGSEAAVVAAGCSSIADGHRKQLDLIDASTASAAEIARSLRSETSQDFVEASQRSLSEVEEHAKQIAASSGRLSGAVAGLAQSAQLLSDEADVSGTAVAQVAAALGEIARSTPAVLRQADDGAAAARQTSQSIAAVVASTEQVAANARSAATEIERLAGAVDDASRSAHYVGERAATAASSIDGAAVGAAQLERSMRNIAELAREVAVGNATLSKDVQADRDAVAQSIDGIARLVEPIGAAAMAAREVDRRVTEVTAVVSTVNVIAERTNLLSLNAAIEAAHAGEAGRGFVVIAEELRSLAERASNAASEVTSLLQGLKAAAQDAMTAATHNERLAGDTAARADVRQAALSRIVAATAQIAARVEGIAPAADEAVRSSQQVAASTASAAAEVREVSAAAAAHAKDVGESAENCVRARAASADVARATTSQAHLAREALTSGEHTVGVLDQTRAALLAQDSAIAELSKACEVARSSTASAARRLKEQTSAAARAVMDVDVVVRASADLEDAWATAAQEITAHKARMASADEERAVALEAVARTLAELRGITLRSARTANESSVVSAALQQRMASLV